MNQQVVRVRGERARYAVLGDEVVVMNPLSWDTHVLNPAAGLVFEFLAEGPRTLADIESLLADVLNAKESLAAASHARRVVAELTALGLVAAD